jgi:hypothetical protein
MRSFLALGLMTAVCVAACASAQTTVASGPMTLSEYVQVLDDSLARVRALKNAQGKGNVDDVLRSLPVSWKVQVDNQTFEVATEPIRAKLGEWQTKHDSASIDSTVQYLEMLCSQAAATELSTPDVTARRNTLANILARREFRNVEAQTWWDRLKQRILEMLGRWLGHALSAKVLPIIGDILVYGLIIVAVMVLAYWMYRSLKESARLESIMPVAVPVSAKQWPIWIAEARAAAARGDWSDAIHLAYWGGISFLEIQGAWRPDVARTPREYLRLLPAGSEHQPALRALTMRLESVWYGMQPADEEGLRQTFAELERLGCASS